MLFLNGGLAFDGLVLVIAVLFKLREGLRKRFNGSSLDLEVS